VNLVERIQEATWRTATGSGSGDQCVEVADLAVRVGVRDSKDRDGTVLALTRRAWGNLIDEIRTGYHNHDPRGVNAALRESWRAADYTL
jgi:hypothetical protein